MFVCFFVLVLISKNRYNYFCVLFLTKGNWCCCHKNTAGFVFLILIRSTTTVSRTFTVWSVTDKRWETSRAEVGYSGRYFWRWKMRQPCYVSPSQAALIPLIFSTSEKKKMKRAVHRAGGFLWLINSGFAGSQKVILPYCVGLAHQVCFTYAFCSWQQVTVNPLSARGRFSTNSAALPKFLTTCQIPVNCTNGIIKMCYLKVTCHREKCV